MPKPTDNGRLMFWGLVLLWLAVGFAMQVVINTTGLVYGDEQGHLPWILGLMQGDFATPNIANPPAQLPGYHSIVALLCLPFGPSLWAIRATALLINVASLALVLLLARRLDVDQPSLRALQVFCLPVLFPYLPLIYTDIASLGALAAVLWLGLGRQLMLAGMVGFGAFLLRQSNIVWLAMAPLATYFERYGWLLNSRKIARHVAECALFLAVAAVFIAYVAIHGQVALTGGQFNRMGLYIEGPALSLVTILLLLGPAQLTRLDAVRHAANRWWTWLIVAAVAIGVGVMFRGDHAFNQDAAFIHNWPIVLGRQGVAGILALATLASLGAFTLCATPLARPAFYVTHLFWLLAVVPAPMAEWRYALFPIVLVMLTREHREVAIERVLCAWFAALSLAIFTAYASPDIGLFP